MTVAVRPASTVMLVRDAAPGRLEVLLLRRHPDLVFVAGAHVFPGGAVEPSDGAPEAATGVVGLDDAAASRLLGVAAGGMAYWIAAVRETFEEAGLLLARTADGDDPWLDPERARRLREARPQVEAGTLSIAALCAREALVLDLAAVRPFGRWITPVGAPRRYDTRFFVAPAPPSPTVAVDRREAVAAEWVVPANALERFSRGDIDLILPTERSLLALAEHRSTTDLLAWLDTEPTHVDDHGGRRVASPDDGAASVPSDPHARRSPGEPVPVGDR